MITIATYSTSTDAYLARSLLESDGLRAAVLDEHLIGAYPLLSAGLGGIKLVVPPEQAERAGELLARVRVQTPVERCPECGADDVEVDSSGRRLAFLTTLLLMVPIGRARPLHTCADCGHEWRQG